MKKIVDTAVGAWIVRNQRSLARNDGGNGRIGFGVYRGNGLSAVHPTGGGLGVTVTAKGWRVISSRGVAKTDAKLLDDAGVIRLLEALLEHAATQKEVA